MGPLGLLRFLYSDMNKLSVKAIDVARLQPGASELLLSDGANLVLRVRPTSKAWLFRFRFEGTRDKLYLGEYPALGLAAARERAARHRETLAAGKNPKVELEREKQLKAAEALAGSHGEPPVTVRQLCERWKQDYLARHHEDKGNYVMGTFERHLYPDGVEDLHIDLVRQRHVRAVLDRAYNNGLKRTCGVLLANLRQMFQWAVSREWVVGDPTATLKAKEWEGRAREGKRVLSDDELVELFSKLPESSLGQRWRLAVALILACTTRVEETTLAERRYVDLARGIWRVPVAHQKAVRSEVPPEDHLVFLSDFAKAQLEALMEQPGTATHIFPAELGRSEDKEPRAADEKTLSHAIRDRQIGIQRPGRAKDCTSLLLADGEWTVHDLRRTSATLMGALRVPPHVIEKCLNHATPNAVQRIYNRAELEDDMRDAWAKLGEKLAKLQEQGLALYRQRMAEQATEGLI